MPAPLFVQTWILRILGSHRFEGLASSKLWTLRPPWKLKMKPKGQHEDVATLDVIMLRITSHLRPRSIGLLPVRRIMMMRFSTCYIVVASASPLIETVSGIPTSPSSGAAAMLHCHVVELGKGTYKSDCTSRQHRKRWSYRARCRSGHVIWCYLQNRALTQSRALSTY